LALVSQRSDNEAQRAARNARTKGEMNMDVIKVDYYSWETVMIGNGRTFEKHRGMVDAMLESEEKRQRVMRRQRVRDLFIPWTNAQRRLLARRYSKLELGIVKRTMKRRVDDFYMRYPGRFYVVVIAIAFVVSLVLMPVINWLAALPW
jgi:hypothetical protein